MHTLQHKSAQCSRIIFYEIRSFLEFVKLSFSPCSITAQMVCGSWFHYLGLNTPNIYIYIYIYICIFIYIYIFLTVRFKRRMGYS